MGLFTRRKNNAQNTKKSFFQKIKFSDISGPNRKSEEKTITLILLILGSVLLGREFSKHECMVNKINLLLIKKQISLRCLILVMSLYIYIEIKYKVELYIFNMA